MHVCPSVASLLSNKKIHKRKLHLYVYKRSHKISCRRRKRFKLDLTNMKAADGEPKTEENKEIPPKQDDAKVTEEKKDDALEEKKEDVIEEKKEDDMAEEKPLDEKAKAAVTERLKFFFSDANVRQDKYLRKFLKVDGDDGNGQNAGSGTIPAENLVLFNTIKVHTSSVDALLEVAKSLPDMLTVDDEKKEIGRKDPFVESKMDENIPRTLYVSNLPVKENRKGYLCTSDEIKNMFDNKDSILIVKMKFGRTRENFAKNASANGGAMVEFDTIEQQQAAAAQHLTIKGVNSERVKPAKELKLQGNVIDVISLRDYVDRAKANKKRKAETLGSDTKKKVVDDNSKSSPKGNSNNKEEKPFTIDWKPGCVISVKGLSSECDREAVVAALATALDKSEDDLRSAGVYIDYSRGQPDGAVRFPEPCDDIATVIKKLGSGDVKVKETAVSVTLLEGDDEKNYWEKFIEFKKRMINRPRDNRRNNHSNKKHRRR